MHKVILTLDKFFLKYEIDLPPSPEKTTLKKPSLIRVKVRLAILLPISTNMHEMVKLSDISRFWKFSVFILITKVWCFLHFETSVEVFVLVVCGELLVIACEAFYLLEVCISPPEPLEHEHLRVVQMSHEICRDCLKTFAA